MTETFEKIIEVNLTALLYHAAASCGETSPFDDAVLRVAYRSDIKIVSPYIGLRYLQRLIDVATSWALVSDIEAWLSSLSVSERGKTLDFIHSHLEKIHHFPAIHAKTVISPRLAYLGSANLTSMGILNRTEMGVLLEDIGLVDELNGWFDGLWSRTAPPEVNEIDEFVQWLDLQRHAAVAAPPKKSLSSGAKKVRAHLAHRDGIAVPVVAPKLIVALELEPVAHQVAPLVQLRQKRPSPLALVDIYEPGVVVSLIDRLVANGFIFRDFVKAARLHGCQRERQRDLYHAILPFCANHARSAFEGDTINRLLIVSGRFVQSTTALLTPQQAPFDAYLSHLILALSFDEPRELPSISQLFTLTGLREAQQKHLITSLAASRMLVPAEEVPAGSPQHYTLRKKFTWSRRFQLFSKAYRTWTQGLGRAAADYAATQTKAVNALDNAAPFTLIQPVEASSAQTLDITATTAQRVKAWLHKQSETATEAQDAISPLPDDVGEIFSPSELPPRVATCIVRQAKNAASGETGEPIFSSPADRIDMVYLQLAKILEQSTGFFNFKTIEAFALYLYAHYQEDKGFIEHVLIGNINKIRLFDISIDKRKTVKSCKVEVNLKADMSEYPKTYSFMKKSAEVWQKERSKKKNVLFRIKFNPGFFARTVGLAALAQCDPVNKARVIEKETAQTKKALAKVELATSRAAARQSYLDTSTVNAIKQTYAQIDRADQVFESLLFLVQLYGNCLPLNNETELFKKISDRTNITTQEVESIFNNQSNPFALSILSEGLADSENFCCVELNHYYTGNLNVLPRTKKMLDTDLLINSMQSDS